MKGLSYILLFVFLVPQLSFADIDKDFKSLGSSEKIIRRAKKLDTKNRYQIVQKREVDRNYRFEVSGQAGMQFGGDSYYDTNNYGAGLDFHVTPRWSVGVRYLSYNSKLTNEGERVIREAQNLAANNEDYYLPALDNPKNSTLAIINYYPLYGKMNIFNKSTIQFDVYLLGGGGVIQLEKTGNANTYTAGGGVGMWLTQHVSTRFELRYQGYKESYNNESRNMHLTIGSFAIGVLF